MAKAKAIVWTTGLVVKTFNLDHIYKGFHLLEDVMTVENSNAQLVAINTDGNSRLINGDIRKNYFQVGSTWMSLFETNQQAGTIRLSNSTMETYTQATNARINIPGGAGLNCFSCHDTGGSESPAPKEVFLSHVFFNTIAK